MYADRLKKNEIENPKQFLPLVNRDSAINFISDNGEIIRDFVTLLFPTDCFYIEFPDIHPGFLYRHKTQSWGRNNDNSNWYILTNQRGVSMKVNFDNYTSDETYIKNEEIGIVRANLIDIWQSDK